MTDNQQTQAPPVGLLLAAAIIPLLFAALIQPRFFIDDAGFFLRYAEHLSTGNGYVFNLDEAPIWGATAPLWPLLIALGKLLGLQPEFALLLIAYVLSGLANVGLSWFAWRQGGLLAGIATIVFAIVNTRYLQGTIQGMESPLSYALIAAGLVLLCAHRPNGWWLGLVAGLSLVHKIDFAAWGILLLAADLLRQRKLRWIAWLVTLLIAAGWYGFAWHYFGQPWPNSLTTKLTADYASVGPLWFVKVAFLDGGRKLLLLLAAVGIWHMRNQIPNLVALIGMFSIFAAAYTLRPPPEAFEWYVGPLQPLYVVLAAIGVAQVASWLANQSNSLATAIILAVGMLVAFQDLKVLDDRIRWVSYAERDRVAAAKWVREHTAADARVLTSFGNVAYYCQRYVLDSSYLNRVRPSTGNEDFIADFKPEAIVDAYFQTGLEPAELTPPVGYQLARVFANTQQQGGFDFFVVVFLQSFDSDAPLPESMQERTIAPGP